MKSKADYLKRRFTLLTLVFFGFSSFLIWRAVQIQLIGDPRIEKLSQTQFRSHYLVRPRRGIITDRNGEALAVNVETKSIAANPLKIRDKVRTAQRISKLTGIPTGPILKKLNIKKTFVWLQRNGPDYQPQGLAKAGLLKKNGDLIDGIWLVKETKREYPHGELASHLLGSVNIDSEGIEGIELQYNDRLRGKVTSVHAIKDALGRPAFIDTEAIGDVKDGQPVALTIDAGLQFAIEDELARTVSETQSLAGTAIVMDADSGEILAMANRPSFNPNLKNSAASQRRNRGVTDGYEPGSTLKAVLAASAFQNGWKNQKLVWGGMGSFKVQGRTITEAESHEKFGWLSLPETLKVSSNVGAAKIALEVGATNYFSTLRKFGFGAKTGIDFPGELSGWLPVTSGKKVQPLTLATLGFGQGIFVTPLQMTRAFAAFINGGYLIRPRLMRATSLERPAQVISRSVAQKIVSALVRVVTPDGTGAKAALPGYRVAGKTGTSQLVETGTRKYSKKRFISSFIGFGIDVSPRLVIFTMLDSPKGFFYASETAAPLFRRILEIVVKQYSIPPLHPEKILAESLTRSDDQIKASQAKAVMKTAEQMLKTEDPPAPLPEGSEGFVMPNLVGLSPREVLKALANKSLRLQMSGFGFVVRQMPAPGQVVASGREVKFFFSDEQ